MVRSRHGVSHAPLRLAAANGGRGPVLSNCCPPSRAFFFVLCPTESPPKRCAAAGTELDRFRRCVAALHRNIMGGYDHWCEHVGLPMRVPDVEYSKLSAATHAPVRSPPLSVHFRASSCFEPFEISWVARVRLHRGA